jgi:PAS domain S-box-containing protein
VFDTGETQAFAFEYPTPAGARWFEVRLVPEWRGAAGSAERPRPAPSPDDTVLAIGRDATAERAAEAALRASEERFRQMAASMQETFWLSDLATRRVLYVSPAFERIWGFPSEAMYADPAAVTPHIHPDDRAATLANFDRMRRFELTECEYRIVRPDGAVRWLWTRTFPVYDADGRPRALTGIAADVTERKRVETALEASEAQLRLALDVAGLVVWEWDPATDRLRELGAPPAPGGAPSAARPAADFAAFLASVHPADRERVARAHADAVAGGDGLTLDYRAPGADGAFRSFHAVGRVLRDPHGRAERMIGVTADVTERAALEARVRQAQRLDAAAALAGGVAHEFNNLLTIVSGHLEFARRELPAEHPAGVDLEQSAAAAERLRALVRQLLTFSRRQPARPRRVPLAELLAATEALLRPVLGDEIALDVRVHDAGLAVWADPGDLEQALVNLAINARDAMLTPRHGHPGTGGTLGIELDAADVAPPAAVAPPDALPAGRYARLRLWDTGHGMDAETQARALDPFFTTKPVGTGAGLGLATVFGTVRQAGGSVQIDSAPGRGARFTILLPLAAGEAADAPPPRAEPGRARRRTTVLLAEDEPALRRLARRMLERDGHQVIEAHDGGHALRLWEAHRGEIDALVTDARMPVLGGYEVVARVRADAPALPVVIVSGYVDRHAARSGGNGGPAPGPPEAFVEKPFTAAALLGALARVLAGDEAAR